MTTASINLPLYRALRFLNVDEDIAASAAEASPAPPPVDLSHLATKEDLTRFATKEDLTHFATKEDLTRFATKEDLARFATRDELRAEIAGVRAEIAGVRTEIAQTAQRLILWLIGAMFTIAGLVVAFLRFFPTK